MAWSISQLPLTVDQFVKACRGQVWVAKTHLQQFPWYPVTFTFRGKTFDMPSGQFDLVHRSDLHVPLVILKAASPKMQGAKFVVNSYKCNFHQRTNSALLECPTLNDGLCYCGVDELYEAVIDEIEKTKSKFSKRERRWMDHKKMQLLQKHKDNFSLVPVPKPGASGASLGGAGRMAGAASLIPKPSDAEVSQLLQIYLTDRVSSLSTEKQRTVQLAARIADEIDKERRSKAEATDPRSAWLGDRLNDAYLAMQGVTHRLTPHQMDQIRQRRLSTQGLSNGMGRAVAENVESQVGKLRRWSRNWPRFSAGRWGRCVSRLGTKQSLRSWTLPLML
ncbi:unnamed protein product [Durusdinium trenchii]|uniref:Uncharacterized protein n=1 Tax=Durusdinium trenchii TaxID=1381693 RepID=A0ABP0NJM3_9DINO